MLSFKDIKKVELELSSMCNASCPLCPRNLFGYDMDLGYTKRNLTLKEIKTILDLDFLSQLEFIKFEGNFGDPLANPEILDIIDYLGTPIKCVTNGNFRNENFWKELARRDVIVEFGIDGINQKTHSRYRKGTNLQKILKNAETFINNGGTATWKMIKFNFNEHQSGECDNMSKQMGFSEFILVDHGRNSGPVFDQSGKLIDVLGDFSGSVDFEHYINLHQSGEILIEDITDNPKDSISCQSLNEKMIYISSEGKVFPCCFMGFTPEKYGKGRWHEPVNKQIKELCYKNDALVYDIRTCIEWFNSIPTRWDKPTFESGRLIVCDSSCGSCKKSTSAMQN